MSSSSEVALQRRPIGTHVPQGERLGEVKTLTKRLKTETPEERTNRYDEFIKRVDERFQHHALLNQPRTRPRVGFDDQDKTPLEVTPTPHRPVRWKEDDPLTYQDERRLKRWGRGETPQDFQRRRHTRRGGAIDPRTGLRM